MKKCINCNSINLDEASFCVNCGIGIKDSNFTYVENTEQIVNNNNVNIQNLKPNQVPMSDKDRKNANLLCIISLICGFGPSIITALFKLLGIPDVLSNIFMYSDGFLTLAGIVLMIIDRVNYPQSKFAKVVMWIYIVLLILFVIGIILLIIFIGLLAYSCSGYSR